MSNTGKTTLYRPIKRRVPAVRFERRLGDRRLKPAQSSFPASLMTHMIVDHLRLRAEPSFSRQPLNVPISAYKEGAKITVRRMPAGSAQENIV